MSKYSKSQTTRRGSTPIVTTDEPTFTYEGDTAFARTPEAELFMLAVVNMGEGEDTFYESSNERQSRYVGLIHKVTESNPEWMQNFIPWLRKGAYMRTASVVAAAEYVKAGGPNGRKVVSGALQRADEPAEIIGYWFAKYGRKIPKPLKRGVADATGRLYTEYSLMKYDSTARGIRPADVIELTHPSGRKHGKDALYEYALDRRHHPDDLRVDLSKLPKAQAAELLKGVPEDARRDFLREHGADALAEAGMTWERLSSWLPGGMDAEAWEWVIPSLGYMALIRNLRNFDEANISTSVADQIIARIKDPEQVAKSMQFPYRFYSAFKNTNNLRWHPALEEALNTATLNIPPLNGRSLVLVDVSGSMSTGMSGRSTIGKWEAGAVFGIAQFCRAGYEGDLVAFGTSSERVDLAYGTSVLLGVNKIVEIVRSGRVGHGTETWEAVSRWYNNHDRIFIVTDMQSFGDYRKPAILDAIKVPIYAFNLGGYRAVPFTVGENNRYEFGGLTDTTFRQIALLEQFKDATWPWE